MDKKSLLAMTADIVAAHASANILTEEQLLVEIHNVFAKLSSLDGDSTHTFETVSGGVAGIPTKPAVPLEAAFGSEKIFCMICGRGMKTLKRHLGSAHGLKPGQYRRQFNIPAGTPLVAKEYSERRKETSKKLDLPARLEKARAARGKNRAAKAKAAKAAKAPRKNAKA